MTVTLGYCYPPLFACNNIIGSVWESVRSRERAGLCACARVCVLMENRKALNGVNSFFITEYS